MKIKQITSAQNSTYKQTVKYNNPREARKAGVFLVEGIRAVDEVLQAGDWQMESLWLSEELIRSDRAYVQSILKEVPEETSVYAVAAGMFDRLADTETPQGVLAVVKRRSFDLAKVLAEAEKAPLIVILENLQDPGNVGTILRTADSAGATAVVCTRGTADIYNSKVVRSTMGSLLHLPVCHVESVEAVAGLLEKHGVQLLAAHLKGRCYHFEQDMKQPIAILIGNEGAGLSAEAAEAADALVKIPMLGRAESLNAAMAAGILIYEAVRQRMQNI